MTAESRDIVTPYQEALAKGELLIQQCQSCQALIMYPRHRCPVCQSAELGWLPAEGTGVLQSYTVQRVGAPSGFEQDLPFAIGVVRLEEGVQLLARLVPDAAGGWDSYACDVAVRFQPTPVTAPVRGPAAWFEVDS
jgi:uncharacterized OB-fold protein